MEKRCGWYHNPTPANHWLVDRDGEWTLSLQGSEPVPGFQDLTTDAFDFGDAWVKTNGYYGYGCACIDGVFGPAGSGEVAAITRMQPIALARCERDPALPGADGD